MRSSNEANKNATADDNRAVSILVVSYQSADDLDRCLHALQLAAPRSPLTISAWDNASTDQSVSKFCSADIAVTRSPENVGFAAAVNQLASKVSTPFIFLLDPDAAPLPGAIDVLVDAAIAMPDREMFCGQTVFENGQVNPTAAWGPITPYSALMLATGLSAAFAGSPRFVPEVLPDWDRRSDREVAIATGCALLVRTNTWRALGGFDPRYWLYGEEAELQLRMLRSGRKRAWFVSDAKFIHDKSASLPLDVPLDARVFRNAAILRGRATFMRHAWTGAARWTAGPILGLTALRHGLQSLAGGPEAARHRRLWQMRGDWMAGYPPPDGASGALSQSQRMLRLLGGLLDPRAYLHALRIVNFYNYTHSRPRRQISIGDRAEISPNATFSNGVRIRIGARTLIAARASLMAGGVHGRILIGEDCLVGPDALVTAANYRGDPEGSHRKSGMREADVVIEDNVWIGAGAVILPGVKIGRGAIVGAGTVISRDVAAGAVQVGAAARTLPKISLSPVGQEGDGHHDKACDGAPESQAAILHRDQDRNRRQSDEDGLGRDKPE